MSDEPSTINRQIGQTVRQLRAAAGLSLDALAGRSGVSRSMISSVERGDSSPTAVLLERLSAGLGVPLASLFDPPVRPASPVARLGEQVVWQDPASGYVRRAVSPAGAGSPIRIVEVRFPAGQRVTYETAAREGLVHQQVWVLEGCIEVSVGPAAHRLETGDCLAMVLDQPVSFHNPSAAPARYAVVLAGSPIG